MNRSPPDRKQAQGEGDTLERMEQELDTNNSNNSSNNFTVMHNININNDLLTTSMVVPLLTDTLTASSDNNIRNNIINPLYNHNNLLVTPSLLTLSVEIPVSTVEVDTSRY